MIIGPLPIYAQEILPGIWHAKVWPQREHPKHKRPILWRRPKPLPEPWMATLVLPTVHRRFGALVA
jgi:hypothetical protein